MDWDGLGGVPVTLANSHRREIGVGVAPQGGPRRLLALDPRGLRALQVRPGPFHTWCGAEGAGFETPTPEIGAGWMAWFERAAPHTVDMGHPFMAGREVSEDGTSTELDHSGIPITGYTIVNAESMNAAQALLDGLPMIHSTRIYELGAM